jgi:hypothetical protein
MRIISLLGSGHSRPVETGRLRPAGPMGTHLDSLGWIVDREVIPPESD